MKILGQVVKEGPDVFLVDLYDTKRYQIFFVDPPATGSYAEADAWPYQNSASRFTGFAPRNGYNTIEAADALARADSYCQQRASQPKPVPVPAVNYSNNFGRFAATTYNKIKDAPHPSNNELIVVQVNLL